MRKCIIMAVFAASLVIGAPAFAQHIPKEHESEYFYVNVTLEKVSPYRAGYVVQYRKMSGNMANLYLPKEWFEHAASKGEVIYLPPGKAWPSLSVYYKDGAFSHVKLYVHRWKSHESWGNIRQNVNIDDRFENVESVRFEF